MKNMKNLLLLSAAVSLSLTSVLAATPAEAKSAIVYFSKFENTLNPTVDSVTEASFSPSTKQGATAYAAHQIAKATASDVYPLLVKEPYPASFDETIARNHEEQSASARPALKSLPNLSHYDTVYLGFPIWNMALPQAVESFISVADLEGKRVVPFCTHDGYGCASAFRTLKRKLPQSEVEANGIVVPSSSLSSAPGVVASWLKRAMPAAHASEVKTISCKVGGKTLTIELNNSPEAKEFYKQLPLKARMGEFGGREFYGPMPGTIHAVSKGQYNFEDGTLTYCPTNDTVAIFYAQSARPNLTMAVYPMGKVTSDLSVFKDLRSYETFEFTK